MDSHDDPPSRLPGDWSERCIVDEFARRQNLLQEAMLGRPTPPLPGDILVVPLPSPRALFWVVLTERVEVRRHLVVPADTSSLVGSQDLAISRRALCGPLVLRLGLRRWWPRGCFEGCRRVGVLEDWHLSRTHGALMQLLKGDRMVMPWQEQTDLDPAYRAWLDSVGEAVAAVEFRSDPAMR